MESMKLTFLFRGGKPSAAHCPIDGGIGTRGLGTCRKTKIGTKKAAVLPQPVEAINTIGFLESV